MKDENKTPSVGIRFPPDLLEAVKHRALVEDRNVSSLVIYLVRRTMAEEGWYARKEALAAAKSAGMEP